MPVEEPTVAGEDRIRICGVTHQMSEEARRRMLQWVNKRHLKYFIADRLVGLTLEQFANTTAQAFAAWQAVCGLTFARTMNQQEANFFVLTMPGSRSDGPAGVLAEHELPPGDDRALRGWYDFREQWWVGTGVPPTSAIGLLNVMTHEIGHGIGLPHEETGAVTALLDPFYNRNIIKPQEWDIRQAQLRYGPAVEEPLPPVDPPVPPGEGTFLDVTISTPGKYRIAITPVI